jgi:predicted aspartyl protease
MDALPPPSVQVSIEAPQPAAPAPNVKGFRPIALKPSAVGHFHAQGRLNGQLVEIIIDTGASGTVVDRQWAEAQKLPLVPMGETGGGVGGAAMTLARVDGAKLELAGVPLPDVAVVAIDLSTVAGQLRARGVVPPQVVVGVDVLRKWRAVIDYATATMWLAPA